MLMICFYLKSGRVFPKSVWIRTGDALAGILKCSLNYPYPFKYPFTEHLMKGGLVRNVRVLIFDFGVFSFSLDLPLPVGRKAKKKDKASNKPKS